MNDQAVLIRMHLLLRATIMGGLLSLCGCAARTSAVADTSAHAKYVLVAALDSWRTGKVATLTSRKPAIRFVDDDQRAGLELADYEFENEAAPILPFQNVKIVLSLRNKQGQVSQKAVTYQVGVEPGLTVLRSDN